MVFPGLYKWREGDCLVFFISSGVGLCINHHGRPNLNNQISGTWNTDENVWIRAKQEDIDRIMKSKKDGKYGQQTARRVDFSRKEV